MSGNALIVSRYFPPGGGVGAFRSAKFVKYLTKYGWDSYVVSLPQERQKQFVPDNVNEDQFASLAEIPEKRIYIDVPITTVSESLGDTRRLPILAKRVPELVEEYNIDVVYQTAPPFYSLPAVAWVKRKTEVPYVIDFRDPWYLNDDIFTSIKSVNNPVWRWINARAERLVIKHTDKIILNTSMMEKLYSTTYPEYEDTFTTITNGFDPDDYTADPVANQDPELLQLIYPGRFREGTTALLHAIQSASEANKIRLLHFGVMNRTHTQSFFDQASSMGLRDQIENRGYAKFPTVVSNIKGSDVGLVVTRRNDPTHVPAKTYDYIACNLPILAVCGADSALAQILEPFEHAYIAAHDDADKLSEQLTFLAKNKPNQLDSGETVELYSRSELTRQLSVVFEEVRT